MEASSEEPSGAGHGVETAILYLDSSKTEWEKNEIMKIIRNVRY